MRFTLLFICFFCSSLIIKSQENNNLYKITASDRSEYDCFGWATGIYGEYCVVGSPEVKAKVGYKHLPEVGALYILKKQKDNSWKEVQKITPEKLKAYDFFGGSVSIFDKYIAVGANGDDSSSVADLQSRNGAVYIYKLLENG